MAPLHAPLLIWSPGDSLCLLLAPHSPPPTVTSQFSPCACLPLPRDTAHCPDHVRVITGIKPSDPLSSPPSIHLPHKTTHRQWEYIKGTSKFSGNGIKIKFTFSKTYLFFCVGSQSYKVGKVRGSSFHPPMEWPGLSQAKSRS